MRNLSSEIFYDEFIGKQSPDLFKLWIGLILIADDQGRQIDDPDLIKSKIFPYSYTPSVRKIEADLKALAKAHKIIRYVASGNGDGRPLIQIVNWWHYQFTTQWAGRSKYPAPGKEWFDHIRVNEAGGPKNEKGHLIPTEINWKIHQTPPTHEFCMVGKEMGTYLSTYLSMYPNSYLGSKSGNCFIHISINNKELTNNNKYPPTPLPPSSTKTRKAAGGREKPKAKSSSPAMDQLKPKQKRAAETIAKILRSSGLSEKKIYTLNIIVAMRSSIDPMAYTLAALASAYADPKANNKPAIAAHRMETDQVDPAYLDPETWVKLPAKILKAAGIEDAQAFLRKTKAGRMQEMIKQLTGGNQ